MLYVNGNKNGEYYNALNELAELVGGVRNIEVNRRLSRCNSTDGFRPIPSDLDIQFL